MVWLEVDSKYIPLAAAEKSTMVRIPVSTPFCNTFPLTSVIWYGMSAPTIKSWSIVKFPNEGLGYVGLGLSYFGEQKPEPAIKILRKVRNLFKSQKNVAWHQNARIMIGQIKGFAAYPPNFANLWLTNNLKVVRDTYESSVFKAFVEEWNLWRNRHGGWLPNFPLSCKITRSSISVFQL